MTLAVIVPGNYFDEPGAEIQQIIPSMIPELITVNDVSLCLSDSNYQELTQGIPSSWSTRLPLINRLVLSK